ncbi:hypothetical protein ACKJSM_09510 [Pseudomonas sp. PHC1]|uniref:hypothetical protein n=1 Tax=Pseudomonas sp. PHC1 TaxID=3384759 RepID=UPI00396F5557
MKQVILLVFMSLLFACASAPVDQIATQSRTTTRTGNDGAAVATALNARYAQTSSNCFNSETAPVFLCRGIIIRATVYGDSYNVWDPSPVNISNGFVAFSYMSTDSRFPALYNRANNGFIVKPISQLTAGQLKYKAVCFYVIDGATDMRADGGCGQHAYHGAISRYCSLQGITTADQFIAHYMANTPVREQKQCSWDVRDNSPYQTAALFRQALAAMPRIPKNGRNDENELVVAVWTRQPAANMPIEAFFYTDAAGLIQAKKNQSSYYTQANSKIVPIIKLTINATNWAASFSYNPADQNYL